MNLREVNKRVMNDTTPLPRIESLKEKIHGARYFSKLDCRSGYLQVRLTEESNPIVNVVAGNHTVAYTTLIFGLKSSPGLFQTAMSRLFDPFINCESPFMFVYIDDCLIYSRTEQEHLEHLQIVFSRLKEFDLQLNREKCLFGCSSIFYLGHILDGTTLRPHPDRVKVIREMPLPADKTALRSFLGMLNQYKDFIPNLRGKVKTLDLMTSPKESVKLEWTSESIAAFEWARDVLSSEDFLVTYDPLKKHVVECDASDEACGAVLLLVEIIEGKQVERVIEYFSKSFNSHERNYSASEKETFACILSLRHWRHYLALEHFTIRSDCHGLCVASRLGKTKHTIPDHQRLARWAWILQDFDFEMIYIKGTKHVAADCLSRNMFPKVDLQSLIAQEMELTGVDPFAAHLESSPSHFRPLASFCCDILRFQI